MMETLAAGTEVRGLPAAVGHTPLVALDLGAPSGIRIYAKLESVNPGGSIKDRPVLRMLTEAVRAGRFNESGWGSFILSEHNTYASYKQFVR